MDYNFLRTFNSVDILREEMFKAEERIFHIRGSRSSFDTAIPRFEAPAAYSTFHLDAEVFIGA